MPPGAAAFAVLTLVPLPDLIDLERRIDTLSALLSQVGPVKHEINNPLMGIAGYAELLRGQTGDSEMLRELDAISEQCRRIASSLERLDAIREQL